MVQLGYQTLDFADIIKDQMSINRDDLMKTISRDIIQKSMVECGRYPISSWEDNLSSNQEALSYRNIINNSGEKIISFSIPEASFSYSLTKKEGQIMVEKSVADLYGLQDRYNFSIALLPSVKKFWEGIHKLRELPAKISELEAQYQHINEYTRLYKSIKRVLNILLYKPVYDYIIREWNYSMIEASGKLPDFEYLYDNTPALPAFQEDGTYCVSFYIDIYCVVVTKKVAARIVFISPDCDKNRLSKNYISDTLNSVVAKLDYEITQFVDREINYHRTQLEKFQNYKENKPTLEFFNHGEMKKQFEMLLNVSLVDLDLSEKTIKLCNDAEFRTIRDLVSSDRASAFAKIHDKRSFTEIEELLYALNLCFGMDCNDPIYWTMDPNVNKIIIS